MNTRIKAALCLGAAVTLLALPLAYAQTNMDDQVATRQTITDIRNVGTAMYVWYKEEVVPKKSGGEKKVEEDAVSADIAAVPVISREELAKVLVPKYIASIPEKDGWGNPYEFHLNTTDPNAEHVMGLRSAGKDGRFSSDVYSIGSFEPRDADQDIPWMDGFFLRWPEAKKTASSPAQ